MDLSKLIAQFFGEDGSIQLAPQLTLAGMAEMLYMGDLQLGGGDRHCMRFWDYSESREGTAVDFTRTEINTRIKAVAARLQQVGKMGDRVAILAGNSPEYLFGFIGALYAGQVPVPLYDPEEPGHGDHLKSVLGDAGAKTVLTNTISAGTVREYFAELPARQRPRIVAVDSLPDSLAESFTNPSATAEGQMAAMMQTTMPIDSTAFLQYTSGSTRNPAGVELTNRSILTNVLQMWTGAQIKMPLRLPMWLPMHHDMGIILSLFVTILGLEFELMTPRDFVQQPKRWVDQLAKRDTDEGKSIYTVVPNFALELAARYGKPEEGETPDFSHVDGIIIGSEPVTQSAVEIFAETFGPYGLKRESLRPSYGLAEASLLLSTPQKPERPIFTSFDRDQLAEGKAVPAEGGVVFASNGQPVDNLFFTIVDPETKAELPDGVIGELWAHGENNAVGYLGREKETQETFRNSIGELLGDDTRVAGAPADGWMATGDLGTMIDGEVYITGRLKDLVVIAGRNHYPQDIEATVSEASEHVRPDSIAAFAVPGADVERLVIFVERADDASADGDAAAEQAIREAVTNVHGIAPEVVRFYAPNEIARSSSGKIARRVNQKNFLAE
ncbi:FadD32-like long-chain-fatty-acid--AMP ligase [Corynebacterium breve]|uniref:FadD32-like long-chain-fatty-acid--AMP ligase n=1 Tax=Corynebacterium breve TaxID=3049799 RepID=A0ABY8VEX2_9CORY|nr:FadD32-like long-chain-fatty-acid--AMP ligase [Corynebacterium breve]WIM67506.1 FadD32-like long-chain-fatty-acid--AMP ligase [Corynebacterium breve]